MKMCALCGDYFEPKSSKQKYCSESHQRAAWYKNSKFRIHAFSAVEEKEETLEMYRKGRRWGRLDANSSPDAMRELAGLKPIEIKGAMTISEFYGKEVTHIYENSELLK